MALRDATRAEHDRVDMGFSRFALADARSYGAFLSAHARALAPLEAAARPDAPRMALLARDLEEMDLPLPAPLTLFETGGDAFRWGLLYALEGSRLGGAMLARQVGSGLPTAYLSATHDRGGWLAFQARLDDAADQAALAGDVRWQPEVLRGALAAFDIFARAADVAETVDG